MWGGGGVRGGGAGGSYATFVLSLFVHRLFFWCLGKAVLRGFGNSWIGCLTSNLYF